jgi:YegS/Rv2252/BmrU family lipid kinase
MKESRCVIFNPAARGEKAVHFRRHLSGLRDSAFKPTTGPGAARVLAAQAVMEGFETVIAAGGDGTLNEVVNGIGDVPGGFGRTRLGVIPLGTVNVFAREMGIPPEFSKSWEIVVGGWETVIDLPQITCQTPEGECRRYFVQMAGAGLDARAVELVSWKLKKAIGPAAYLWAGLNAMLHPQPQIQVTSDGGEAQGELVIIGNGRLYGGSFALNTKADYADGILDVCVFPKVNWARLPFYAVGILTGRHERHGLTTHLQAGEIRMASGSRVAVQVDGEAIGMLPATIRTHRRTLRVLVPESRARR